MKVSDKGNAHNFIPCIWKFIFFQKELPFWSSCMQCLPTRRDTQHMLDVVRFLLPSEPFSPLCAAALGTQGFHRVCVSDCASWISSSCGGFTKKSTWFLSSPRRTCWLARRPSGWRRAWWKTSATIRLMWVLPVTAWKRKWSISVDSGGEVGRVGRSIFPQKLPKPQTQFLPDFYVSPVILMGCIFCGLEGCCLPLRPRLISSTNENSIIMLKGLCFTNFTIPVGPVNGHEY